MFRAEGPDGTVAIKLLGAAVVEGETARARFRREIEALARVEHPALVRLLDHGVDDELGPYLVTPLLPGRTLREVVGGRRICPEAAALLAEPIAAAAAALHAAGFVHRDLKPENAIGTPGGDVVVIDLGLAWREGATRHTSDGMAVGSVGYMAPEQIEGREVGPAADVWSIGVMLYEWIAGRRPFARARASEEAAATLVGAFTPLAAAERRCGEELSALVASCLASDPAARPAASEVAARLAAVIDWSDDRAGLRAAAIDDGERFVERVAPWRVRQLERMAKEAVESGRPFAALAMLDRALAYAPGRAELEAMVAEVEERSGKTQMEIGHGHGGTQRRLGHGIRGVAIAVFACAIGVGATWVVMRADDAPVAAVAIDAGVIDAAPVVDDGSPLADLPPIPLDQLRNDAPGFDPPSAKDGDPIVDPGLLGGRTPDEAVREVDAALAANPSDRNALFGRALVYLAAARDKRGLALLDEALELHPSHAPGWAAKAYVEVRRGRWDAAEAAFARALELDPQDGTTLRNRGIMRHRLGRARDAYQDLRQALAVDPGDVEAMYELVQLYARTDREHQTRRLLERIVRMRPTQVMAWLDLSLTQPPQEALASVRRALELAPELPRGHQRLCNVLVMLQDAGALAACDRAVALAPDDAATLAHRGVARYLAGDDPGALADLDRAIALDPDDGEAHVNRAMVRTHAGVPGAREDLQRACRLDVREACASLK